MPSNTRLSGFCETLDWRPLEFVDLPATVICSLCNVVPKVINVLECYHLLCDECYEAVLQGCGRRCPMDEQVIKEENVNKVVVSPRQILRQRVFCVNAQEGCHATGTVEEMRRHFMEECAFHSVNCSRCDASVLRRDIVGHVSKGNCGSLPSTSEQKTRDRSTTLVKTYFTSANGHDNHSLMEKQLNELQELLRSIMEREEHMEVQLDKIRDTFCAQEEVYGNVINTGKALETCLEEFKSRFSATEDGIRKCSLDILSIKEDVNNFIASDADTEGMKPMARAIFQTVQKMKAVEQSVSTLPFALQSDHSEGYFHLQDFSEFRSEGEKAVVDRFSDVFVFCGYSVKLHAQDNGIYLGLYLRICQGPRDPFLKWPFMIPYTLMLVHPTDQKKNIEQTVTTHAEAIRISSLSRGPNIFGRPTTAMNSGWANGKLCTLDEIMDGDFVFGNSICLGVKVAVATQT